jgi:hypothetical protein
VIARSEHVFVEEALLRQCAQQTLNFGIDSNRYGAVAVDLVADFGEQRRANECQKALQRHRRQRNHGQRATQEYVARNRAQGVFANRMFAACLE